MDNDQHVYHHTISDGPRVNVKIEKNSKGYNWEVTVTGAKDADDALEIISDTEAKLFAKFASTPV